MINACRRFYIDRHGEDGWFEVVERAYHDELVARAERERDRRTARPDYASMTPADLQSRVKLAIAGGE